MPGASPAELELARAELDGARVEGQMTGLDALPLRGELLALARARAEAERALDQARTQFVATRYADAHATIRQAEERTLRWAGDPRVARALAQLALVAAQSGESSGYARAAARFGRLDLDPARWSPDVRAGYERARAARDGAPQGTLAVGTQPPGAAVLVDGVPAGRTPLRAPLPVGPHAILVEQEGTVPAARAADIARDAIFTLALDLAPLADDERLGALRSVVEAGVDPGPDALAFAAQRLGADAVAVVRTGAGPNSVHAVVGGPGVAWAAFEHAGQRLAALRQALADVGRHLRAECGLAHTPPERGHAGRPLTLQLSAGACLARVRGAYRHGAGQNLWSPVTAELAAGAGALTVPALPSSRRPYVLEYHLTGETARGSIAGEVGSPQAPVRVLIDADLTPAAERAWYRKWWVWAIAGVVAAGTTTAVILLERPGTDARL